ncbi:hypothetical protein BH11PSE10_BH11PSE10_00580 [soil metagenome]
MALSAPFSAVPAAHLLTARLVLRAPLPSDLEAMFELHADPIANRFSPSGPLASREASAALLQCWLAHWQAQGFGYWAIAEREQPDQVIGFGGVMRRVVSGVSDLYLYFRFRPQAWGQGLASEMALAALELAFENLAEARVLAVVLPVNTPSRKTLERIGLLLKSSLADVPGQSPNLVYEITAERFAELPKTPPIPTPFGA